jgi:hypothetical protein
LLQQLRQPFERLEKLEKLDFSGPELAYVRALISCGGGLTCRPRRAWTCCVGRRGPFRRLASNVACSAAEYTARAGAEEIGRRLTRPVRRAMGTKPQRA